MLDLILVETDDLRPQLQRQITITDNASDADLFEMIVRLVKASGWDPLDLRDNLIEEFPLEEEDDDLDVLDFLDEEVVEFIPYFDVSEVEPNCVGCDVCCEDTACLVKASEED